MLFALVGFALPASAIVYPPPGTHPFPTYVNNELIIGFTMGQIPEEMMPQFEADVAAIVAGFPKYIGYTVEYGYNNWFALVHFETNGYQPELGHGDSYNHLDGIALAFESLSYVAYAEPNGIYYIM